MFRWYKNAVACYVYLSDVTYDPDKTIMEEAIRRSRWFTRGWTLQELIAPRNIVFFDLDWRRIATKDELSGLISKITAISEDVLMGGSLETVSVAKRMSWASHRVTSRIEDIAYCLLGIFDINLPLIYGEGTKAFRRLQEVIMNTTHDQSLFAWGRIVDSPSGYISSKQGLGLEPIPWKDPKDREPLMGLFADSPADFALSHHISPVDHGYAHHLNRYRPPAVVNGGALLNLVILESLPSATYWDDAAVAQPDELELAVLLCHIEDPSYVPSNVLVGLALHPWGDGYYSRTRELLRIDTFVGHRHFQNLTQARHIMPYHPPRLRNGDIILRNWNVGNLELAKLTRPSTNRGPAWRLRWRDKVLRMEVDALGDEEVGFLYRVSERLAIRIILRRMRESGEPLGSLLVGASYARDIGSGVDGVNVVEWELLDGEDRLSPKSSHVMELPSDSWECDLDSRLRIRATVSRVALDGGRGGAVDVLDFFMLPKDDRVFEDYQLSRG